MPPRKRKATARKPAPKKATPKRTRKPAPKPAAVLAGLEIPKGLELHTYDEHREGCGVAAGEISPAWYVPPIVSTVEEGQTVILLRCNDAQCDAAVGWPFRNALDVLEERIPGLGHASLPGEEPPA